MKKKFLFKSLVLVALMIVINTSAAWAVHTHCVCGDGTCTVGGHSHAEVTWGAWTSTTSLPTSAGYWYLDVDVTLSSTWTPANGVFLCLNGHVIKRGGSTNKLININGGTFTLTDCKKDEPHYFNIQQSGYRSDNPTYAYTTSPSASSVCVKGGCITGGYGWTGSPTHSPCLNVQSGTFNFYGGNLVGNSSEQHAAGMKVYPGATLNMYGGNIEGNYSSWGYFMNHGTANIYGGSIKNNSSANNGMLCEGTTNIYNLEVSGNVSYYATAGITAQGNFKMLGGMVTGNRTTSSNGGIQIETTNAVFGGNVKVVNNFCNAVRSGIVYSGGNVKNLYLPSDKTVAISATKPFVSGANIGVTTAKVPTALESVKITSNGSNSDAAYFTSDKTDYRVKFVTNHLELKVIPPTSIAVTTADKWFKKGDIVKIEGTLKDDSKSGYKSLSVLGLGKTPIDATSGISNNAWSYTYTGPNTKGTDLKFVIMNNNDLTDTASYTLKVDTVAPYAKSVKINNSQYKNVDYTDQWIVDEENLEVTIQLHDTTSGGLNSVTVLCDGTPLVADTHYSFNPGTGVLKTFKGVFENKLAPTTLSVSAKDLAGNLMEKDFLFKTCYGRIIVETDSMKTLENVDFRTDPYPYHGGAVYIYDRGTFNANNVVFDGNVATLGSAIYNTGTTNLNTVAFAGNKAKMGGAIYNFDGTININGFVNLVNDSDTWVNEGYKTSEIPQYAVTNWNLGKAPNDNEVILAGYEKFANYGRYAKQTITVAKNQAQGSYLIATGDFSNVENKDKFYITGVEGQEDIAVFITGGATKNYDGQGYTLRVNGVRLYLEIGKALKTLDVAVSSMNKATIYSDKNLVVPAGVRVFGMRWDDSKNMLVCTNSRAYTDGDILPAEMGYVIEAPAATYSFLETEQDASVVSLSELSGVVVETPTDEVEGTVFTLANGYNGVGFYTFVGETLKANKAFYNSTNPNLKGYLGYEEATGIETSLDANANANANALYNLQGVKVNNNYRGVVIKNGKKVIMK